MPLIAFVGDAHYRFNSIYVNLLEWQKRTGQLLDAIVHVGDWGVDFKGAEWSAAWCRRSVPIPTYVNMGNHENIHSIHRWQAEPDRIKNLTLMEDGKVYDICGLKIGALWGNFSPRSWMNPERVREERADHREHSLIAMHILKDSVDELLQYDGKMDVLITHDCASCAIPTRFKGRPIPDGILPVLGLEQDEKYNPGCPGITQLLDKFHPTYHIFGHFHDLDEQQYGDTKVICLNAFDYNPNDAVKILEFQVS